MPRKTSQPPPQRRATGKGPVGTPADRLLRAWLDEDDDAFGDLAEELIAGAREGVLSAALRKYAERYEDEAVDDLAAALVEIAEAAEGQDAFDFAELVLLPVVAAGPLPDPAPLARGLAEAGVFPPEARVVFAEGWRAAEMVGTASPVAIRRALLDIAGGRPPADLPAQPEGEEAAEGAVAVLVGALAYGTEPPAEDPDADPELLAAADEAREDARAAAFDRWLASLDPEATANALVLPPCAPSELMDEIRALLEEAEGGDPVLDEIADFVEAAREEAGEEEVVARLAEREDGIEVAVLTRSGRALDARVFGDEEGSPAAEAVRRVVEARMPVLG